MYKNNSLLLANYLLFYGWVILGSGWLFYWGFNDPVVLGACGIFSGSICVYSIYLRWKGWKELKNEHKR